MKVCSVVFILLLNFSYMKDDFRKGYTIFGGEGDGTFVLKYCVQNVDETKTCIFYEKFNKKNDDHSYAIELFSRYFSLSFFENKCIEIDSYKKKIKNKR